MDDDVAGDIFYLGADDGIAGQAGCAAGFGRDGYIFVAWGVRRRGDKVLVKF